MAGQYSSLDLEEDSMMMTSADSAEVLAEDLLEDSEDSLVEEAHPEAEELEGAFN